jgi:hypothetical protein
MRSVVASDVADIASAFCLCIAAPPPPKRFISDDDPGMGGTSANGDGGAGQGPGRAAALSSNIKVREWSAARESIFSGFCAGVGFNGLDALVRCFAVEGDFEGGRGGEGVRIEDETKSSKSSRLNEELAGPEKRLLLDDVEEEKLTSNPGEEDE